MTSLPPQVFAHGQTAYLIWLATSQATYFYSVQDIASIANIETLFNNTDGAVYRLTPRAGS